MLDAFLVTQSAMSILALKDIMISAAENEQLKAYLILYG